MGELKEQFKEFKKGLIIIGFTLLFAGFVVLLKICLERYSG